MKKLISYATLCVSLLIAPAQLSAISAVEQMVFCEISKVIIGVLSNPTIAHPYLIVGVLIKKMRLLLAESHNLQAVDAAKVAALCKKLECAVEAKQGALTILSILQETEPFLSPDALSKLKKLSKPQQMCLLEKFSRQIKHDPQGTIEHVENLFRC